MAARQAAEVKRAELFAKQRHNENGLNRYLKGLRWASRAQPVHEGNSFWIVVVKVFLLVLSVILVLGLGLRPFTLASLQEASDPEGQVAT